ncbi:DUF3006 domain-containing protein [Halorubrum yunnanense]|jgi:hypothetical protein|uniref:DUF3006 domain-containing protein n=1 Tax=Halorubrum yunnanense TaxID=1526162 RepID=A0ABD5YFP1_9EURY|nr:DUF3006 domain-containing protein [Halorubrum yunnanense]
MTTSQYIGVLDRFEDDLAVILLEQDGDVVDEQGIDRDDLPAGGDHVDAVFQITRDDSGAILELEYDAETTRTRKERAQSRFDRLAERPPTDDES